jgi:DNA-directed RNA polymerase specialized sigma24 family protein
MARKVRLSSGDLYTADYVQARFTEMGAVIRTMPDREARWLARGWRATWPEPKPNPAEAYGYNPAGKARVHASTQQIDRCDECLDWLLWLKEEDRTIVLAKACRAGTMQIARKLGLSRTAVWMRHRRAINRIARRLNEGVDTCDALAHRPQLS